MRRDKLRSRLGFWKAIGCDSTILSWIAYGKKLTFYSEPEQLNFPNHHSIHKHKSFATETCEKAILDGSFRRATYSFAHIINPIQVEDNGRKLRMCHDTRYPNSLTATCPFHLSSLGRDLHLLLRPRDNLLIADLEKAYYSIPCTRTHGHTFVSKRHSGY